MIQSNRSPAHRSSPGKKEGSVLIITLGALMVLLVVVGIAFDISGNVGRNAARNTIRENALAVANGTLQLQFAQWRCICGAPAKLKHFPPVTGDFQSIVLPNSGMFPVLSTGAFPAINFSKFATTGTDSSYLISNYKVVGLDKLGVPTQTGPVLYTDLVPVFNPSKQAYNYLGTVDVTLPARGQSVTVKLGQLFQYQLRSPWSYAIFYNGDLEINPSPTMNVTGDVFTNGNLYAGAGGGQVNYQGSVSAAGTIQAAPDPNDPSARPVETTPTYPVGVNPVPGAPMEQPSNVKITDLNPAIPNDTSYHEIVDPPQLMTGSKTIPDPTIPDPFSPPGQLSQRYYNEANYKVTISNATNDVTQPATISVTDQNNNPVSAAVLAAFQAAITPSTTTTIQDSRESAKVVLTNVDLSLLTPKVALNSTTNTPLVTTTNGMILYIRDTRPTTTSGAKVEPAIRLINGGKLPDYGLTIASQNPVYVQGDYNTGGTSANQPASNGGSPGGVTGVGSPTVNTPVALAFSAAGTPYWEPAAIVADAVNILSNAWKDGNTEGSTAKPTTINAGIMSGNVPDSSTSYSGGVENFPRFHEKWTGVRFSYFGSMVCIFQSKQATGPWGSATYNPPDRYWNFDTKFLRNPPPGSFTAPAYQALHWFIRP